jgi:HK97 family phage portal protein
MISFFSFFRSTPTTKNTRSGNALALYTQGRPVWTPRDYAAFAKEGYQQNAVVHRCVRLICEAASTLPLTLLNARGEELLEHPLLRLLRRPNPHTSGLGLLESVYTSLHVAGNAYLEAVALDNTVRELYSLRPDRMQVVVGRDGWPESYLYRVGSTSVRYNQHTPPLPPILHLKNVHPSDDCYGFSPMEAAAMALDVHNSASAWNKALLDNAARPSGALVYATSQGAGTLTEEQFERLKSELEQNYQGQRNAGRPLLLEGGLDWKPLSMSPRDMDFIETKATAAREIALAFGVPPLLLGLSGDNTHSNYAEANRAFYRQTVIPLVTRTMDTLTHWLAPVFEEGLRLLPDLDSIEALASEREALWSRVTNATFLTDAEKREAVGYGR